MTNNVPARVRHPLDATRPDVAPDDAAWVDPRVARTTRALGRALVALLEERAFDAITVQDILDRAGVGRTAFYAHYRNKEDVLHSSYEGVFAWLEPLVERPLGAARAGGAAGARLFPVAELLAHVGEERALVDALRRDGLLDDMWGLLAGYAARMIARRLDGWVRHPAGAPAAGAALGPVAGVPHGDACPPAARDLLAHMLAGALVESVRWWQDHPTAATPAGVDAAFHDLAWGVLRRPRA
ncbi:TetR family transcriptional regulator [Gemmatimonadetes bacterium T265]|nr:TetR family transcriptional regulator [Gemmatimonadetes bacterium T265]